jgi:hypothetical protein
MIYAPPVEDGKSVYGQRKCTLTGCDNRIITVSPRSSLEDDCRRATAQGDMMHAKPVSGAVLSLMRIEGKLLLNEV